MPTGGFDVSKQIVQTRWVEARLAAKGHQDPDLREGLVDTSGCVSLRSPHLQVISLSAIKKWKLRNLDIKNAFLQEDAFARDVLIRAPAYGLKGALAAFRRP